MSSVRRLGTTSEEALLLLGPWREQVPLLDMDTITSVHQAIDGLNVGLIRCPQDYCVVYSISNRGFFLLMRDGAYFSPLEEALSAAANVVGPVATEDPEPEEMQGGSPEPLERGVVLELGGGRSCRLTGPLGAGSFGTVWAAEVLSSRRPEAAGDAKDPEEGSWELAVKEIICQSQQDLAVARLEAELLRRLGPEELQGRETCPAARCAFLRQPHIIQEDRIPVLVSSMTETLGTELWRVRLAMTRVPGVPLDRYFEEQRKRGISQASTVCSSGSSGGDASLNSIGSGCSAKARRFLEACHIARELVSQLSPVLGRIASVAYHRDVNSHNIMVDATRLRFGLVDFGLAVDIAKWRGPIGASSWHLVDIGGDCRYWPMSAWLQFECGWQELAKYPTLAAEYRTRLDLHALGLVALQVVATLCPLSGPDEPETGLPEGVTALLVAWRQYWDDATRLWARLLQCFRTGGDQDALKVACATEGAHNTIGHNLAELRAALREALQDFTNGFSESGSDARPLFGALLELLCAGGASGFDEEQEAEAHLRPPPSWEAIAAMVGPEAGAPGLGRSST